MVGDPEEVEDVVEGDGEEERVEEVDVEEVVDKEEDEVDVWIVDFEFTFSIG